MVSHRRAALLVWLWLLLAVYAGWAASVLADDRAEHSLEFVDATPLELELDATGSVTTTVAVRNTGPEDKQVQFVAMLQNADGVFLRLDLDPVPSPPALSQGYQVTPFTVTLTLTETVAWNGHLTVQDTARKVQPGTRELSLAPAPTAPPYVAWLKEGWSAIPFPEDWRSYTAFPRDAVVLLPGLIALLPVGYASAKLGWRRWGDMVNGVGTWEAAKSWASNLAGAGAVLNLASAQEILPETTRFLTSGQYSVLALLFAAIALLGPALFMFLSRSPRAEERLAGTDADDQPVASASVRVYLLANGLTLWAVYGELVLAGLILDELRSAGILPWVSFGIFMFLVFAAALLLFVYAQRKMREVAKSQPALREVVKPQAARRGLAAPGKPRGPKITVAADSAETADALRENVQANAGALIDALPEEATLLIQELPPDADVPAMARVNQPRRATSWTLL